MRTGTVSVIVPVYNAEKYLSKCVDSILGQSFRDLEIVLVDDGAKDASSGMCDEYAKRDGRVKVLHKENGGLMSAWMAGVRASGGEYLCFVDSDDWVDRCMIEELMKQAEGKKGEVICCNFVIERPGGPTKHHHELGPGTYEGEELEKKVRSALLGRERRTISMSRCMKLFSRELITENMKYCNPKIRMGEDVNIVLPALCDCSRVVILKEAEYYHYFYNTASMVHKYDAGMYEGICELIDTIRRIYVDKRVKNWEEQWKKESIYLLMLAVKNELRGGRKGYAGRVDQICGMGSIEKGYEVSGQLDNIKASDKGNRILLWVMKRPDRFRCFVGKELFELYDKISNCK